MTFPISDDITKRLTNLLILAIVLLLSACGPNEDIPGAGYEPSAVEIAPATPGVQP